MACFNPDTSRVRDCPHAIVRVGVWRTRVYCGAKHRRTCPAFTHNCLCLLDAEEAEV